MGTSLEREAYAEEWKILHPSLHAAVKILHDATKIWYGQRNKYLKKKSETREETRRGCIRLQLAQDHVVLNVHAEDQWKFPTSFFILI